MPCARPTNTPKSVIDLIGPLTLSPRLHVAAELFPRVGLALLHAQADAALVLVDLEHHDLDLVAQGDDLGRGHVLVGPVHLGDVHQAFNAGLDLDERAVVGDVGDLAEQAGVARVAARHAVPRVVAQLLDAQRRGSSRRRTSAPWPDSSWPTVTTSLGWRTRRQAMSVMCSRPSMPPRSTNAPYSVMFLTTPWTMAPSVSVSSSLARSSPIEASTTARRDSTTLLRLRSSLMTLNSRVLPSYGRQVLDRAGVDQRAGQEGADAVDQHGQAALDLAADGAGDEVAGLERGLQAQPGGQALGLVARQDGVAVAVFDGVDGHRDEIADLDFKFALVVLELFNRDVGFALEAGVHHHVVELDAHDFGGDDLAGAHVALLERFFEQGGKRRSPPGVASLGLRHVGSLVPAKAK
jgi:hypothetical protein